MQKRLSLTGLAEDMTATHSAQRTVLHRFKYPDSAAAMAMIKYYHDARTAIMVHHREGRGADWLRAKAQQIEARVAGATPSRQTKLRSNARALRSYARHFADREFELMPEQKLALTYDDVLISVRPDMHVRERQKEKLVRLDFSRDPLSADAIKIIVQCMFEAALAAGLQVGSSQVLLLDVHRGEEHRGARMGARRRRDIEAACQAIAALWPSI